MKKISIIGIVGLPANYGGFETLVENIVKFNFYNKYNNKFNIYCSSPSYSSQNKSIFGADLFYLPLRANGASSIFYDIAAILFAIKRGSDVLLILGVSGCIILPFIKIFSNKKIIVNIDGVESRRNKWGFFIKAYLKFSELLAIKFSDIVISDNKAISEYLMNSYNTNSQVICYGGDHSVSLPAIHDPGLNLPKLYCLSLSRIEPENNVEIILEAFSISPDINIVYIGNWSSSKFGIGIKEKYSIFKNIILLDPIYDIGVLRSIRQNASAYIHGHSVGGTNPSLVEIMFFRCPIIAFDCSFNRYTTNNLSFYFISVIDLIKCLNIVLSDDFIYDSKSINDYALNNYSWREVSNSYFKLF